LGWGWGQLEVGVGGVRKNNLVFMLIIKGMNKNKSSKE
jgi:hypothetical protein